jgi:EpsI family protein
MRTLVLAAVFAVAGLGRWHLQAVEPAPASDLSRLPLAIEEWSGRSARALDADVLRVLGADDYVNRVYHAHGEVAAVYVGYHRTQKFGAAIHSPLNCLPGAGWQPLRTDRIPFGAAGTFNRVLIQKGEDRAVVIYWYQTPTRIEASEYWSKFYLVTDAFTSRRNDAALVRVVAPVDPSRADGQEAAARVAYRLAELVQPRVAALIFPDYGKQAS